MRTRSGTMLSLPWSVTNLPVPVTPQAQPPRQPEAVLLSPVALLTLVRFLRRRASEHVSAEVTQGDGNVHLPR